MRLIAILMLSTALTVAADEPGGEAELYGLLDTFLAGASANDREVHNRFWADDLVYTSSAGQRFGKAEIMTSLDEAAGADEAPATPDYAARDVAIRVYGETAAITFTLVATDPDGESTRYYNTGVFRKRDGQWQAVVWQATRATD